ncbi:hypothetical protein DPMN_031350 [Dreissena polymorpha]|uniref:Uncharacterized protein n=1 Tax=Dreissena polymorpha TaxID=45954 RepID=A0A9D4M1S1_DREPO|nr:hypothetical protein DPMN_031350 [Dreissena polymorpha]
MLQLGTLVIVFTAVNCSYTIQIDIRIVADSTIELTCMFSETTIMVKIYKLISNDFEPVIKIGNIVEECDVTTELPSNTVRCVCLNRNRFVCNISEIDSSNELGQWKCATFKHTLLVLSHAAVATKQDRLLETTSSFLDESAYTSAVTLNAPNDVSELNQAWDLFNNVFIRNAIIISTTAIVFLLATTLLICVYRKFKTHTEAVNPFNDGTGDKVQGVDNGRSTEQLSTDHVVDHYELIPMMNIPPMAESFPLTNDDETQVKVIDSGTGQADTSIQYFEFIRDTKDAIQADFNEMQSEPEEHTYVST